MLRILASILAAAAVLLFACSSVPRLPTEGRGPQRAMWVTRFDYRTQADVERIVDDCANAKIDTILFQVRGNATVSYRSKLEPWGEQWGFQDPGFDPLAVALERARARGIELHAWINVVPAWWGTTPPADPRQIWNAKPEWSWFDQQGERQRFSERFYVSLNPCLPEVRAYLVEVARELAIHYPVDGIHLDYIRFPNEPPATPKGLDYPRDARTLKLFRDATGKTPESDRAAWDGWRTEQVTQLVRDLRKMLSHARPRAKLSAAVGWSPDKAKKEHFQDSRTWLREGLLDVVYPMNYANDFATWSERARIWSEISGNTRVVMGIMAGDRDAEAHRAFLDAGRKQFDGWSLFAYAKLFESRADVQDKLTDEAKFQRAQLRKALVPILREQAGR
ncbi:MAG: family 10 glycosylhydrolase [Planctomycetes bacterium]|nr:family 10 glycosylhydrolase [Planctomycetota bacterium]